MFGFYSFSENPFSSASAVSVGEVKTGVAVLSASGAITANGSANLPSSLSVENSGSIESIGSVIIPGQSLLQGSGNLTSNLSRVPVTLEGVGSLSSSGNFDSNGTIIHGAVASPNVSGELTSDIHVIHRGFATLEASGSLGVSESVELDGASLLLDAGAVTANGTLLVPIDALLEASGELSSIGSSAKSSASLLVDSGTVSAKGTLYRSIKSSIESSGELTSDIHVVHGGISELAASGTLGVNESVELNGTSLLLDAGTVSAKGTLRSVSSSSIEASGTITADPGRIIPHGSSLSGSGIVTGISSSRKVSATDISSSGTTTNNGTLILGPLYSIESSGTVDPNGSNLIAGKASLTSPGATLIAGTFASGELTASLSVSTSITAQIGLDLESQATIGQSAKEFVRKTSRPNYKPALPKLSNKDIVLDFPFYEGAGPYIHNVSSRAQKASLNGLESAWQREDGIQSLYSPGSIFNNYRITTETTGITFDRAGIVLRFKPTRNTTGREFLFTIRGTANNNNEIDCYTRTANGKVYVKIYNGTSEQALQIPNLVVNEWNTLVVTWGDGDLKGSLNGNEFSTYSSVTVPHATLVGKTLYLYGTSSDTLIPQGYIGAFRWYNRELSIVETKQLHRNIYQDYSLDYIIPNHYEMSRVTSSGRLMKNSGSNISASGQVISRGSFLIAQIKAALGGEGLITANGVATDFDTGVASLQAAATIAANGIVLGELDVVPFTVFINQLEDYNIDVYRTFVKEFNVAKSKAISASIEKTNITDINIDKILEANLEK